MGGSRRISSKSKRSKSKRGSRSDKERRKGKRKGKKMSQRSSSRMSVLPLPSKPPSSQEIDFTLNGKDDDEGEDGERPVKQTSKSKLGTVSSKTAKDLQSKIEALRASVGNLTLLKMARLDRNSVSGFGNRNPGFPNPTQGFPNTTPGFGVPAPSPIVDPRASRPVYRLSEHAVNESMRSKSKIGIYIVVVIVVIIMVMVGVGAGLSFYFKTSRSSNSTNSTGTTVSTNTTST